MEQAVVALVIAVIAQTVLIGGTFTYWVWKNLSMVSGVPPEFARRRFDIEERKLALDEQTAAATLKMREIQVQRATAAAAEAETHAKKLEELGLPGGKRQRAGGLSFVNPEQG